MKNIRLIQSLALSALTALLTISASAQNLFVVNGNSSIAEYDSGGNLVNGSFITGLTGAEGIAFDSSGNLYVAENSGGSGSVAKYSPSGSLIISSYTSGQSISSADGLAFDSADNLYVADYDDANIAVFDNSGYDDGSVPPATPIWVGTMIGTDNGNPYGVAWNNQGVYYTLLDQGQFAGPNISTMSYEAGGTWYPQGLALDSLGNVYFALPGSGLVQEWNGDLNVETDFATSLNNPTDLTIDSSNDVFVATADGILEYDANGHLIKTINDGSSPGFMAVQPNISAVPEPSTLALAGLGSVAAFCWRRHKKSGH